MDGETVRPLARYEDVVQTAVCRWLAADRAHDSRNGLDRGAGVHFRSISDLSERAFVVHQAARTNGSVKQNMAPRWRFSAQMVPP